MKQKTKNEIIKFCYSCLLSALVMSILQIVFDNIVLVDLAIGLAIVLPIWYKTADRLVMDSDDWCGEFKAP